MSAQRASSRRFRQLAAVVLGTIVIATALARSNSKGAHADGPRVIRVGASQSIRQISEAARVARDGDIVEIDAGDYYQDVASWSQNDLTIRAVGGRARLFAGGKIAEDKAIWLLKGSNVTVEHIEFSGARVADENGAGIRHEGPGRLVVRDCRFSGNEMGILRSRHPRGELIVERSEFDHNAVANPRAARWSVGHQIYVGRIARFTLRESHLHHGSLGHLVKSRARESHIYYNRISDEAGGRASYELDFPDGGIAYVIGNIIQQGSSTENPVLIAFAAENYWWPRNELYLAHNTLVDDLPAGGVFVRVWPGPASVTSVNNLLLGKATAAVGVPKGVTRDFRARPDDAPLAREYDYRLDSSSPLARSASDPGHANGVSLRPTHEYVHPRSSRAVQSGALTPGALQSLSP